MSIQLRECGKYFINKDCIISSDLMGRWFDKYSKIKDSSNIMSYCEDSLFLRGEYEVNDLYLINSIKEAYKLHLEMYSDTSNVEKFRYNVPDTMEIKLFSGTTFVCNSTIHRELIEILTLEEIDRLKHIVIDGPYVKVYYIILDGEIIFCQKVFIEE